MAGLWVVNKIKALGGITWDIVAGVVVADYGNTTNEGMQMSRCRSADFNGSSNRYIVCNR